MIRQKTTARGTPFLLQPWMHLVSHGGQTRVGHSPLSEFVNLMCLAIPAGQNSWCPSWSSSMSYVKPTQVVPVGCVLWSVSWSATRFVLASGTSSMRASCAVPLAMMVSTPMERCSFEPHSVSLVHSHVSTLLPLVLNQHGRM